MKRSRIAEPHDEVKSCSLVEYSPCKFAGASGKRVQVCMREREWERKEEGEKGQREHGETESVSTGGCIFGKGAW